MSTQSEQQQAFRSANSILSGNVSDISYNLADAIVTVSNLETRKVSIHRFPPAKNTTTEPQYNSENVENLQMSTVSRDTFEEFWLSPNLYQENGNWKGGKWGSDNLPLLSNNFLSGIFIGHPITITYVCNGTIPYKCCKPFTADDITRVIPGTETDTWSCNIEYAGNTYSAYVCNDPMPQKAIDLLLLFVSLSGIIYVQIISRGLEGPTVDMPSTDTRITYMPGGGEHVEPGDSTVKAAVYRCMVEELGIPILDEEDEVKTVHLGHFNKRGRDPRYSTYYHNGVTFGVDRKSETNLHASIIYGKTDKIPNCTDNLDKIEVRSKKWVPLDLVADKQEMWMIPEHSEYLNVAKQHVQARLEKNLAENN